MGGAASPVTAAAPEWGGQRTCDCGGCAKDVHGCTHSGSQGSQQGEEGGEQGGINKEPRVPGGKGQVRGRGGNFCLQAGARGSERPPARPRPSLSLRRRERHPNSKLTKCRIKTTQGFGVPGAPPLRSNPVHSPRQPPPSNRSTNGGGVGEGPPALTPPRSSEGRSGRRPMAEPSHADPGESPLLLALLSRVLIPQNRLLFRPSFLLLLPWGPSLLPSPLGLPSWSPSRLCPRRRKRSWSCWSRSWSCWRSGGRRAPAGRTLASRWLQGGGGATRGGSVPDHHPPPRTHGCCCCCG